VPLRKFLIPPSEEASRHSRAETVKLFPAAEKGIMELFVGQLSPAESPKRKCTENDERSLNVIENTGRRWGISGNVIDKTGG